MDDRDLLRQILHGQGAMQEGLKAVTATVNEIREESRSMRQAMTDTNLAMAGIQSDIRHLRDDAERSEISNSREHDAIEVKIKDEVRTVWEEKRRCKSEREADAKKLSEDILSDVSLKLEKMKARISIGILAYALSVIAFIVKEYVLK